MFSKFAEGSVYRAKGRSWGTVFGRSPQMKAAIQHPFGITLLAMSLLLALAMILVPAMETWSSWTPWVVVWGLCCYGASVFAVSRTRPTPNEPELRELESVRRMIKSKLKERKASEGWSRSAVTRTLEEAHGNLEHQIIPAMAELLVLQGSLTEMLKEFEDGNLPAPDPERLDHLRKLHSRRKATIEEAVVQAANAAATLIALLQEQHEATMADDVERQAGELLKVFEAILTVIRPATTEVPSRDEVNVEDTPAPPPEPPSDKRMREVYDALQLCLRRLNSPPDLARCTLMELLPNLIEQRCREKNGGTPAEQAPIEVSKVLRELIVEEIEMLRPEGAVSLADPAAEHYIILYEQYVLVTCPPKAEPE